MDRRVILGIGIILILIGIYITTPKKNPSPGMYYITLIVDYGKNQSIYKLTIKNESLFDIMNKNLDISYKNYSFGVFITCINGACQTNDSYWMYYVDGKLANVGASSCFVGNCMKNNSVVIWKLEKVV